MNPDPTILPTPRIKHCPFSVMEYDRLKARFHQQALPGTA